MLVTKYNYNEVIKFWKTLNNKTLDDLKNNLESFNVLFAYNSGVIENNEITYYDTSEIFKNNRVVNYTGKLKTIFEISNQRDCYNF